MPFCMKCGSQLDAAARFCGKCGTPVSTAAAPAQPTAPAAAPAPAQPIAPVAPAAPAYQAPAVPFVPGFDFSAIPVRRMCSCGNVFDGGEAQNTCPSCGAVIPGGAIIHIYRMGNFAGMAVGMGIYIDDVPCGHLANKQSIRISVPYGPHKIHMTHTTTRACNDPVFELSPQAPYAFLKAPFAGGGFRIAGEPAMPTEMPTR